MRDLTALFSPKSVAIIGASRTPKKVGAIVLKNIIASGFHGAIYPVNPNTEFIVNLKCFKDIASLPEIPDLAAIALPAALILETLNQVGEKGIKNVVVFSAGFKESGTEGERLENELVNIAKKHDINLLGPNCLGFVNNLCPINVTFGEPVIFPGNLRFVSQSGAIASSLFDWCKTTGLGFSEFITLGNKAVLNENDVLEYFQKPSSKFVGDTEGLSDVHPIGLYLESISNGSKFLEITSKISKIDPIFILKPGKTLAAAKAMQSHTGAIAGEDAVLEAVLQQAGVIRCQTLEDFFDLSRAFAWENIPQGLKVAIISNAGGPAVISADAVIKDGLELADFDEQTHAKLLQVLPRSASILNPVDVLGDALADRFAKASEIILQTDQADALVVILTPQIMTQIGETAESLGNLSKKYQKPIFCSFIGGSLVAEGEQKLNEYKIPSFRFPERAISTIAQMWSFKKHQSELSETEKVEEPEILLDVEKIKIIFDKAKQNNQEALDNFEADEIIKIAGISSPVSEKVESLNQAESFTQRYGFPIVLKLSSPELIHKKKFGGVETNIKNLDQLQTAWDKLKQKASLLDQKIQNNVQFQIQQEIENGVEMIIGVKNDPTFGKVLLFGAGGSLAELISDRNLLLLPVDKEQIKNLVEKSKIFSVLSNNDEHYVLGKLYETIIRLANFATNASEISDIEINPAIITSDDVWAVDVKVILEKRETKSLHNPKFQVATTVSKEILASKFHYFEFELESPLIFEAGQYISIKVSEDRINCYSIAGSNEANRFNLLIDTSPGGSGSKFFENLKVSDKISFLGPFGGFTLKTGDSSQHLLFLATGSGFAPLKCIIEKALKINLRLPITLYLGLTYPEDVFGLGYFQKLKEMYPNFDFKIVVWKANDNWTGEKGFITESLKQNFSDARGLSAYLCGNKNMIENATNILLERGCSKSRIYTEKF